MNPNPAPPRHLAAVLQEHLALCRETLALVESEGQTLRQDDSPFPLAAYHAKKDLLPRLNRSLDALRRVRVQWQRLTAHERAQQKETAALLRQTQELIMKVIVLDRENEQTLLRRGLVPPRHLPPAQRQQPRRVAEVYQRAAGPRALQRACP
ncbi:MAG: hypothetical protein FJ387_12740 [Verrucomicrobia bacterium]|nr:hypothetical protein [Verrucomicrobiota bacterium]